MIKNVFLKKVVLQFGDFIFNGNFVKKLSFWSKFKNYSFEELQNYQSKKLKEQLIFVINNLDKYKNINFLNSETTEELLHKFPILTKKELKENGNNLIVNLDEKATKIFSSGSTGESTCVSMNIKDLTSFQSLQYHLWELCDYKIGDPVLQIGISPKRTLLKKLKDIFFGTIYIPAFSLSDKQLKYICKKLSKNKNFTIIGYPSSANIIAEYILNNNLEISISKVIALGDALLPNYKKNIMNAFNCKVFEMYGASEGFQIGFQVDLDYMYIFTPQVYLELLDNNNNAVKDGEIGNVVVTRLDNINMPLIRYKIGDLAIKLPKDKYPKNRKYNFPLLEKVVGRNTDIVILPDGRKMIVHSFTGVFEYIEEIKQFKIIQKDLKGIVIEYIPYKSFNKNVLLKVETQLQEYILDPYFKIQFKEVKVMSNSKFGKSQLIESYIV